MSTETDADWPWSAQKRDETWVLSQHNEHDQGEGEQGDNRINLWPEHLRAMVDRASRAMAAFAYGPAASEDDVMSFVPKAEIAIEAALGVELDD